MASGDTLATFTPQMNEPVTSGFATLDTRNVHPVLEFDASTQESAVFSSTMPRAYTAAASIDVIVCWIADTAVTGAVVWGISVERIDTALDIDADSFATAINSASTTVPGTSGFPLYTTITLTNAQADAIAAGEMFRLKVARIVADAGDTMAGDAQLRGIEIKQS